MDTRVKAKKTNPGLAQGLKLFINSLYGLCRSMNSGAQLYNKYLGLDVCIAGQVMLYDLSLRMEEVGVQLLNVNTDGIIYECKQELEGQIDNVCDEFSKRTGIELDSDSFDYYFAKDVNNYFCVNVENDELVVAKKKGVFGSKPFYSNLATPKYVMDYFIKGIAEKLSMDFLEPSLERLATTNIKDFTLRAKNNKNYEFTYGLINEFTRYGKSGKPLKKMGVEFIPMTPLGQQFRGYATTEGYSVQNLNHNTGKYGYSSALKTKKFPTLMWHEATPETLNYDYYLDQALELIEQIENVA